MRHPVDVLLGRHIGLYCRRVRLEELMQNISVAMPVTLINLMVRPPTASDVIFTLISEGVLDCTNQQRPERIVGGSGFYSRKAQPYTFGCDTCQCPRPAWNPLCLPIHSYEAREFDIGKITELFILSIKQYPETYCERSLPLLGDFLN